MAKRLRFRAAGARWYPCAVDFTYQYRDGYLAIIRDGATVTVIRGRAANRLGQRLAAADEMTCQRLLARESGNYKRGNER